jgi:hypothetical protein
MGEGTGFERYSKRVATGISYEKGAQSLSVDVCLKKKNYFILFFACKRGGTVCYCLELSVAFIYLFTFHPCFLSFLSFFFSFFLSGLRPNCMVTDYLYNY